MKILIVGGVAGGATTATRLRRLNEKAEIIILERGEYISYANCGLPYYIGNKIKDRKNLLLQTPESFKENFNIDVRVLSEVTKIDRVKKEIEVLNLINNSSYKENYDILVLSTGAEPIKPDIEIKDNIKLYTLRSINDAIEIKEYMEKYKPKRITIIGAGYIGLELLENLYNLGITATLVEKQDHILGPFDYDMSLYLYKYLLEKGINIKLNQEVRKIQQDENSIKLITDKEEIITDMVICSIGITPENKLATNSNISTNSRGSILVNEFMQTNDEYIYALGDVVAIKQYVTGTDAFIPLAGPANKQARIVANNIMGVPSKYKGTQGSSILKLFELTIANTGINEFTAKNLNLLYDKIYLTSYSHATYYPDAKQLFMKVLYERNNGKILGAQIVGKDGVDKRCDILATCIRLKATAKDLSELELCYSPPYSSAKDPINIVGNMIENVLDNNVKNIYVENIDYDNSIIIDTRKEYEFEKGHIKNAINIPLNTIREYLINNKLDNNKKIIIYCQSGFRSYLACRILYGYGYDVYNLSGGYQLYELLQETNENLLKNLLKKRRLKYGSTSISRK